MSLTEQCGVFALPVTATAEKLGIDIPDVELLIERGELAAKKIGEKIDLPPKVIQIES